MPCSGSGVCVVVVFVFYNVIVFALYLYLYCICAAVKWKWWRRMPCPGALYVPDGFHNDTHTYITYRLAGNSK